jgi:hypothetical protein
MSEINQAWPRRYGAPAVVAAAAYIVGAAVILWAWNMIAVDIFSAPSIAFRHAFAAEAAISAVAVVFGFAARLARGASGMGATA